MLISVKSSIDSSDSMSAVFIKPLREGFLLVYCQDRLCVINHDCVIVNSMDVIDFIQEYL
jgi:hypothetical protein